MKKRGANQVELVSPFRQGPIRWLILCGIVLVSAIAIATAIMIESFRDRALQNTERELSNTALLLARHFDREFESFIAIQNDLAAQVQLDGISSPNVLKERMSTSTFHETLKNKISGSFDVAGVNIFDADGVLINSSESWPVPAMKVTDRNYFRTLRADRSSPEIVIELVKSRLSGTWTIVVCRRITGPAGEFLGLVTRGVESVKLEQFFASVALGHSAAIAMHHRDGTLLSRYPHIESIIGKNFRTGPMEQQRVFVSNNTARLTSPVDDQERIVASRALADLPIVIVASTTVSTSLADWRRQTNSMVLSASGAALVVAVILFLIVRRLVQQHRASKLELLLDKHRLNTAINNMTQGLLLFDASGRMIVCNERYLEMYGLSPDVVKPGCSFRDIVVHRMETGSFSGEVDRYCSNVIAKNAFRNVVVVTVGDGRSIQISNVPVPGGGWVATHEDITERKRVEERISYLAHYDALTGLPNRVLFQEWLKSELQRVNRSEQLALLYIDIDEFKGVNDTLGHAVGDELLKIIAARLQHCIRETDFVARLGGDEFAVVQTSVTDAASVVELVNRIHEEVREGFNCLGHQIAADASIGIAMAPQDGIDLDELVKNADLAMYDAKAEGRRTYRFFQPEMDANAKALRRLESDLRQAIADDELEIYYQPLVDLNSNEIAGCEALLRWRHPERGMIPPSEFIPVAEHTGLINQLGEWVISTACAEATTWPGDVKVAVNVSPIQFKGQGFALKVAAALAASGLPARQLELEITEAVLIRDDDEALAMLHQLRSLGVTIALDDFGTGYSSLSYLRRFPFDKIKIDRSFINDLSGPDGSSAIVRAVVTIAADRGIKTIAEGVETQQQRDLLRELGCTQMQGYLFSPAVTAAELHNRFFHPRIKVFA